MKTIVLITITALVVQALGYRDGNQLEGKMQAFLNPFQEADADEKEYAAMDLYNIMKADEMDTSDETGPPSDEYMREIMDQPVPADDQMAYDQGGGVLHGNYVAFQLLYNKLSFISCTQSPCVRAGCPRLYMEGNEWNSCYGEVFRIYRFSGPGEVRVGEVIAINYPRETGKWFGCAGSNCGKATCPGNPTIQYGMQSRARWFQCWGEVFKIYARGKPLGAPIYARDDIMLFYVQGGQWISYVGHHPDKRTCPGTVRPPPPSRYDMCWGENFELWVR